MFYDLLSLTWEKNQNVWRKMWFMEMKVILRFKISGESLDSGKTASKDGSEKIGGAISK